MSGELSALLLFRRDALSRQGLPGRCFRPAITRAQSAGRAAIRGQTGLVRPTFRSAVRLIVVRRARPIFEAHAEVARSAKAVQSYQGHKDFRSARS
jgi:hypothetical protein